MSFIDTLEFNFSNLDDEEEKIQKIIMGLPNKTRKKFFDDFFAVFCINLLKECLCVRR